MRCAFCDAIIVFGGRRVGDAQYCSTHHALLGRGLSAGLTDNPVDELNNVVRVLSEDVLALAAELQELRLSLAESQERVDFLERSVAQARAQPRGGQ